jgi:hypothetical protein
MTLEKWFNMTGAYCSEQRDQPKSYRHSTFTTS